MKKVSLLFILLLLVPLLQTSHVYALSSGYERYKDDKCEFYVEYFPIIPYNPTYPTANEEFAFKFYIWQYCWHEFFSDFIPHGWAIWVFYKCDCGNCDYAVYKRWYPTSSSQSGQPVSWTLTVGTEFLSLGATINAISGDFYTNYTRYEKDGYTHLQQLAEMYGYDPFRGSVYTEGAGSIGIQNGLAQAHQGHHATIWIHVRAMWWEYLYGLVPIGIALMDTNFIIGDDIPSETDCWLTVEQGDTSFTVEGGGGGGGGCPTLFVWNGTDYADEGVLNIHAESDITVQHTLENSLALENGVYKLQLRELDNYTSHIDQVKLYAVDYQGKWNPCPLIYAYHNELGYVTTKLMLDDEKRVDLTPTQTIDLKFLPSIPYTQTAHFVFEINGYNMKIP